MEDEWCFLVDERGLPQLFLGFKVDFPGATLGPFC